MTELSKCAKVSKIPEIIGLLSPNPYSLSGVVTKTRYFGVLPQNPLFRCGDQKPVFLSFSENDVFEWQASEGQHVLTKTTNGCPQTGVKPPTGVHKRV